MPNDDTATILLDRHPLHHSWGNQPMMYRIDACPAAPSRELRPDTRATEFAADSLLVDAVPSELVSTLP